MISCSSAICSARGAEGEHPHHELRDGADRHHPALALELGLERRAHVLGRGADPRRADRLVADPGRDARRGAAGTAAEQQRGQTHDDDGQQTGVAHDFHSGITTWLRADR
ncbi:hypothetical protein [Nocardioides sp. B-3]|uniref:hypothetical protein n=1 Tax=Nocardioides sp. B-3 TaxID=2895565 RepID=UPI0021538C8B|nr:hypothetical protein [Nocardioides sp. B-3]UUZ60393.1 hypothetical protein LP418_05705 [Nocardioides sp. B-3]